MLYNAFDKTSPALINPDMYKLDKVYADTAIMTFSHYVIEKMQQIYQPEIITVQPGLNADHPLFLLNHNGHAIAVFQLTLGAPGAVISLEESAMGTGAKKFVMFGSCGCLDQSLNAGTVIVPSRAYRQEGTSYHYAQPADWIDVPGGQAVAAFMKERQIPYAVGPVWTTDAIYRETKNQIARFVKKGCLAADMECAALQAVCSWRGYEYYPFMYGADKLDDSGWQQRCLGGTREYDHMMVSFDLALALAEQLDR